MWLVRLLLECGHLTTLFLSLSLQRWRSVLAGLLVGLGSSLGNGCTSGHGICGSARLSPRSFTYTASFIVSGMLTATATGSAAALQVAPVPAAFEMPTAAEIQIAMMVAIAGVAAFTALATMLRRQTAAAAAAAGAAAQQDFDSGKQLVQLPGLHGLELSSELLAGVIFALGLGLSGMTRPSKVRCDGMFVCTAVFHRILLSAHAAGQSVLGRCSPTLTFIFQAGKGVLVLQLFPRAVSARLRRKHSDPCSLPLCQAYQNVLLASAYPSANLRPQP